jgi:hypothetical protein
MVDANSIIIMVVVVLAIALITITYKAIRSDEQKDLREKYQHEATLRFSKQISTGAFLEGDYRIYQLKTGFFQGRFPDDWAQVSIEEAIKQICTTCKNAHTWKAQPAVFCTHIDKDTKRMYLVLYVEDYPWANI